MTKYENKCYGMGVVDGVDVLSVSKPPGTEWCQLTMLVNGESTTITMRSKGMAGMLRTMLDQLLEGTDG